MKLVVLERNSAGTDIDVSCFEKFGEVTYYPNSTAENAAERIGGTWNMARKLKNTENEKFTL